MPNTIPPRAGLVGELTIIATATSNKFATAILTGEATIFANGYAGKAASANFLLELIGGQAQPLGQAYNPAVIGIPNSGSANLLLELIGSDPQHPQNLALNWDAGYGWKYGPQEIVTGGTGTFYIHTQSTSSSLWTVSHNLGFRPDVSITSTGGITVDAEINHSSNNVLTITFDIPFSGFARCT